MWSETQLLQFLPNAVLEYCWEQVDNLLFLLSGIAFSGVNNMRPCICDLLDYVAAGLKITLLELHPYFPMLSIHAQSLDSIT